MEAASGAEKSRSISRVSLIGEAVVDRRDCKKGWVSLVLEKTEWSGLRLRYFRQTLIADKARDKKQNDERASAGCCGAEGICCPAQLITAVRGEDPGKVENNLWAS